MKSTSVMLAKDSYVPGSFLLLHTTIIPNIVFLSTHLPNDSLKEIHTYI